MVDTRISFAHEKINVSLGSHFLTVANNLFLFCLFIMQSSSLSITLFNFLYLEVSFSKFSFQRYVISLLFHLLVKLKLSHLLILAILQLTIDFFQLKLAEENFSVNYFHY